MALNFNTCFLQLKSQTRVRNKNHNLVHAMNNIKKIILLVCLTNLRYVFLLQVVKIILRDRKMWDENIT